MSHVSRPTTPPRVAPVDRSAWRFEPLSVPTEWVESYRPGGFHPIHPGDFLDQGRYMAVCKLGYGAFSTVWLAQDNQHSRLVAVKVARADAPPATKELQLHKLLTKSAWGREPTMHVVMPRGDFIETGPNGDHRCLVFEPMGPSAGYVMEGMPEAFNDSYSLDEPSLSFPYAVSKKSLLKQPLLGLDCLHDCRIAHGDVNTGNFLLCIRPMSSHDIEQLLKSSKQDGMTAPVRRIDGKQDPWAPRYLCIEQPLKDWLSLDQQLFARISDLGAAFTFDNPPPADKCATPAALRAPEIILNGTISHKIDIWSLGCLIYEFLTGQLLFQISGLSFIPRECNDDDHLLQMIDTLGQMTPEVFSKWPRRGKYFDEHLQLIRSDVGLSEVAKGELVKGPNLEEAFRQAMPDGMGDEEATQVLALLRRILQYEPSLRPSTSELLENAWFQAIGE
ncbi:serine protein kinase [Teratosphaeria nubilosa]|uniref:non-specific serine/threonine protein kinase n=1 Tax=Teratosphaeria nubilosa TaxID=161662 RepID=A0A6G1LB36_9PEZI|nr:serine protein kinase [Teratosphaeria nubilosa]